MWRKESELTVQQPWRMQTPRGGIKIASTIAQKSSHLPAISMVFSPDLFSSHLIDDFTDILTTD